MEKSRCETWCNKKAKGRGLRAGNGSGSWPFWAKPG